MGLMDRIINKTNHGMENGVEWWIHLKNNIAEIDAYSYKGSERVDYKLQHSKTFWGKIHDEDKIKINHIVNQLIDKYKDESYMFHINDIL